MWNFEFYNMKDWMYLVLIISNITFIVWQIVTIWAIFKKLVKDAKEEK